MRIGSAWQFSVLVLAGARTHVPPGPIGMSPGIGTAQLVLGSTKLHGYHADLDSSNHSATSHSTVLASQVQYCLDYRTGAISGGFFYLRHLKVTETRSFQ